MARTHVAVVHARSNEEEAGAQAEMGSVNKAHTRAAGGWQLIFTYCCMHFLPPSSSVIYLPFGGAQCGGEGG